LTKNLKEWLAKFDFRQKGAIIGFLFGLVFTLLMFFMFQIEKAQGITEMGPSFALAILNFPYILSSILLLGIYKNIFETQIGIPLVILLTYFFLLFIGLAVVLFIERSLKYSRNL